MDELPEWEDGNVAILSTIGDAPHAIPVSTAVRAGPRRLLLALALRRRSLELLRAQPRVALTILAGGDVAVTAHGRAAVVADPMGTSDGVAAIALDVDELQDHRRPTFDIEEGVRWRWVDPDAERADASVRAELLDLAR
jgi:hypothetical protein